jgi:F-type H+-transporting ATPase subunit b
MNPILLLAVTEPGGQVEQIAKTFGVDWQHLGAQIISFCIVCAVLHRFAYRPILKILEERRQQIAQGIANAERIKTDLAQTEVMRQEVLSQARLDGTKFIESARAAAAEVRSQETQKAIAAAEQIMARAREAAAQDHARMFAELRREVGRLVTHTTAAVAGKILTQEDQLRLAAETAKELDS